MKSAAYPIADKFVVTQARKSKPEPKSTYIRRYAVLLYSEKMTEFSGIATCTYISYTSTIVLFRYVLYHTLKMLASPLCTELHKLYPYLRIVYLAAVARESHHGLQITYILEVVRIFKRRGVVA